MINHIIGTMGSGKTTLLTWMLWRMSREVPELHIYPTYDVHFTDVRGIPMMDGIKIRTLEKLTDLSRLTTRPNVFAGDELWSNDSMDSHSSVFLEKKAGRGLLQSRKTGTLCLSTMQHEAQIKARIMRVSSYLYFPRIVQRDIHGAPWIIDVEYRNLEDYKDVGTFRAIMFDTIQTSAGPRTVYIPASFNTDEVVESFQDEDTSELLDLIEYWEKRPGEEIKKFANKIWVEQRKLGHPVAKSLAMETATYIINELENS